jgi:hypothetical protein
MMLHTTIGVKSYNGLFIMVLFSRGGNLKRASSRLKLVEISEEYAEPKPANDNIAIDMYNSFERQCVTLFITQFDS